MGLPSVSGWGFSGTDWGASLIEREWNKRDAQIQMDFQRDMSNTAWQRGVADMKAAGLNPMLAYSQGGASSAVGAMPHAVSFPSAGGNVSMRTGSQVGLDEAQEARTREETMQNDRLAEKLESEIDYLRTQRATSSAQMNVHQQHASVLREESRIKLKEAESAEEFLRSKNAAELQVIMGEAARMRTEQEIDETSYGHVLRYIERLIKTIGSGLVGGVAGFLGGRVSRGQGLRPGRGPGARAPERFEWNRRGLIDRSTGQLYRP